MDEIFSRLSTANIYPVFDQYDDLISLSFEFKVTENKDVYTYFVIYEADKISTYRNSSNGWEEVKVDQNPIGKIPAIYLWRTMPIWENLTRRYM